MNNNGKVFLAALGGAIIGAGVALLFAPASGEETREKLKKKGEDLYNKVKEEGCEILDRTQNKEKEPVK